MPRRSSGHPGLISLSKLGLPFKGCTGLYGVQGLGIRFWVFPKLGVLLWRVLTIRIMDYSILGSMLGSRDFGKRP